MCGRMRRPPTTNEGTAGVRPPDLIVAAKSALFAPPELFFSYCSRKMIRAFVKS
jgi:hypothetical protein